MYAVVSGEKTFTLLPPTDILYMQEKEFPTAKYQIKKKTNSSDSSVIDVVSSRLKREDLEFTRAGCPSDFLTWIATDPDDSEVLEEYPAFRYAHVIRCKVLPGEILYIPGG